MMARARKPAVETLPHPGGGWGNKVEGNERFSNTAQTKAQAQKVGREMAIQRTTEHIIKNQDGKIGSRNSYGHDPYAPKG
jgi:hypothetical protein